MAAFALIWLLFLLWHPVILPALWPSDTAHGQFYPMLLLWLLALCSSGFLIHCIERHWPVWGCAALLFVLCALPRLAVLQLHGYIPTNDFANYLLYGQCFVQGDYGPSADLIANYYQMPKMGGIVVFNGLLLSLFGASLVGLQLANVILTSGICVILYFLIRPVQRQAAWIAALLWIWYPSNILSTQIPTNHHGAVFFFLLALLCYQRLLHVDSWPQILLLAIAAGGCLTVSNLIHPSVIVVKLSLLCFTILGLLYYAQRERRLFCRQNQQLVASFLLLLFVSAWGQQFCLQQFYRQGIITDQQEITVLFKLVLGFNADSNGSFSEADYSTIRALPAEEQRAACLALLRQRLRDPLAVIRLMLQKTDTAWFGRDGYFYWYQEGALLRYSQQEQESSLTDADRQQYQRTAAWVTGAQTLDTCMVHLLYWLAIAGLMANRRFTGEIGNILPFIPMGWIAVILLTEMQSRYRYPAMPIFCYLAAVGVCALQRWLAQRRKQY